MFSFSSAPSLGWEVRKGLSLKDWQVGVGRWVRRREGKSRILVGGYKEEILKVSWVQAVARVFRRMPGIGAGDGGRLSSGVLAGGVGMLMIAAVKSGSPQFSFRSSTWAFRLERLEKQQRYKHRCSTLACAKANMYMLQ